MHVLLQRQTLMLAADKEMLNYFRVPDFYRGDANAKGDFFLDGGYRISSEFFLVSFRSTSQSQIAMSA